MRSARSSLRILFSVVISSFSMIPSVALSVLQSREIWLHTAGLWFDDHLKILQAINTLQRFGKMRVAMAAAKERAEQSGLDNLEYAIYAPPSSPGMKTAWGVTEALVAGHSR